jgi:hypothetical protein
MLVIPHGIPDFSYVAPPEDWSMGERGHRDAVRLITPGFFREDKGLEAVLYALRDVCDRGYKISYRIVGEPQRQFAGQALYRARIESLIEHLDLGSVARIEGRFFSVGEQAEFIRQAHIGVFAYQDPSHASSGTVPLVLGMGRPVLCTPFEYAKSKAQEGLGVFLTDGFNSKSIADGIERFVVSDGYGSLTKAVYDRTRPWTWPVVGVAFGELYAACE